MNKNFNKSNKHTIFTKQQKYHSKQQQQHNKQTLTAENSPLNEVLCNPYKTTLHTNTYTHANKHLTKQKRMTDYILSL